LEYKGKWEIDGSIIQENLDDCNLNKDLVYLVIETNKGIVIVDVVDTVLNQTERVKLLKPIKNGIVLVAKTILVNNDSEAKQQHWDNLWNGYEGSVFRHVDSMYSIESVCFHVSNIDKLWVAIEDCRDDKLHCITPCGKRFTCPIPDWIVHIGDFIQINTGGRDKGYPIYPVPLKHLE
jgi:hypothetical protein